MRNQILNATTQLIRVGHSPDPDDAFMFYALAKNQLDTGDYSFTHELVDIETLNRRAFKAQLELTAVSIHAYSPPLEQMTYYERRPGGLDALRTVRGDQPELEQPW